MNTVKENAIVKYSLKQVSHNRSTLFDIVELKGENNKQPEIFLVPHRKDFYFLALVKEGSSRHWIDMEPCTLENKTMYFTVPHQVHLKEKSAPMIGIILSFTDEFLAIEGNELLKELPIIQNQYKGHQLKLSAENYEFIDDLLQKILVEYEQKNSWRSSMLMAYLRVLLIYLSRLYTEQFINDEFVNDRNLLKKYRALIEEQYLETHDVAAYADQLYISAGHLGEIIKQQSGKTAIEHIHERIMLEAKRLLFHTENSIKEIAFQLGFEDASYFNRFFKRSTSQTPMHYRKATRNMYH